MKICYFSKYPPIEGGTSSRTYWLAKELGRRGHEIHIVTNALEVENEFREEIDFENENDLKNYQPPNVFVHSLDFGAPWHIPYSQEYLARLVNLGIQVIRDFDCDVIDSYYFLPYGIAAGFCKLLTGKPLILRHAGSDLSRLFRNKNFRTVFQETLKLADVIATNRGSKDYLINFGISPEQLFAYDFVTLDPRYFNPRIEPSNIRKDFEIPVPQDIPILTYFGKYLENKGLNEILEAASKIKENFALLIITGGNNLEKLKEKFLQFGELAKKIYIRNFVLPWKIPGIIKASDGILQLENNFPIKIHMPFQPLESLAIGTPIVLSYELLDKYEKLIGLNSKSNIYPVNPQNINQLKAVMERIITGKDKKYNPINEEINAKLQDSFERTVQQVIQGYDYCLKKSIQNKRKKKFHELIEKYL